MKNTFGQSLTVTVFGESHGPAVGVVLDGLAPGLPVSEAEIARQLSRRRPVSPLDTARREPDAFQLLSGVFDGHTTGTPLTVVIPNTDVRSRDYTYGLPRPSHADYAAAQKYHGFEDYRGGGHFSGRVTAALVAAGGILLPALRRLGIQVGTHILRCGSARDRAFDDAEADLRLLETADFPVLDAAAGDAIHAQIMDAKQHNDSVGGVTQTAVTGLPAGLGEPWFDSVEGLLSHALYSIGGVKGVEFGAGFGFAEGFGSELNDPFRMQNGRVVTETNHRGGVNGGVTNGMPVLFQCAVRPTPSIGLPQQTVDFLRLENAELTVKGRHDPAILRRIGPVIDSVTAIVLCDLIAQRFGTDALRNGDFRTNPRSALRPEQNLVLIGMPTCGKTTVGRLLSALTGRRLLDTDELLTRRIGSIPDYIRQHGEEAFRIAEAAVISEVSRERGAVIATGGGAVLRAENVRNLKQNGLLVFLDRSLELLRPAADRPLSATADSLAALFNARYPIYQRAADRTVSADAAPEEVAAAVLREVLL